MAFARRAHYFLFMIENLKQEIQKSKCIFIIYCFVFQSQTSTREEQGLSNDLGAVYVESYDFLMTIPICIYALNHIYY